LPLITAKSMGLNIALAMEDISWQREFIDYHLEVNPYCKDKLLEKVKELNNAVKIDGIVTFTENLVPCCSYLTDYFGLPGNSFDTALRLRNKYMMRQALKEFGVPQPKFTFIRNTSEGILAVEEIGYPVIIKPVAAACSLGVIKADNNTELIRGIEIIKELQSDRESQYLSDFDEVVSEEGIMLEEYIDGDEIAIDCIYCNEEYHILAIHDKPDKMEGPYFAETIYTTPSRHSHTVQQEIKNIAICALKALNVKIGAAHIEMRITSDGCKIIEVAGRLGGVTVADSILYSTGTNPYNLIFNLSLGNPIVPCLEQKQSSGFMTIPVYKRGKIEKIDGIDRAKMMPGIKEIIMMKQPGDLIEKTLPQKGEIYPVCIVAQADTPGELEKRIYDAANVIDIKISEV
jgi:predicted ATP-grasp superfamily ATP-dependent carboligase